MISRRAFLSGSAGGAALGAGDVAPALAGVAPSTEYFVLVHAAGGWDVTLWADPRNEKVGPLDPATTANQNTGGVRLWTDAPFAGDVRSFRPVTPKGAAAALGPGAGDLVDLFDRATIVNGIAMEDGRAPRRRGVRDQRSTPGGRATRGVEPRCGPSTRDHAREVLPVVSIQFPSSHLGGALDPRAIPIAISDVGARSRDRPARRDNVTLASDRADVAKLLGAEARRTADRETYPERTVAMVAQYDALSRLSKESVDTILGAPGLKKAQPTLPWGGRFGGSATLSAAFAIEAMRRGLSRVVAFSASGFDTHAVNYRNHALTLQDLFQVVVAMVRAFDAVPHPTLAGHKLSDHLHVVVFSEFCRTPQLNLNGGRDHYLEQQHALRFAAHARRPRRGPNRSGELLPVPTRVALGERAITPRIFSRRCSQRSAPIRRASCGTADRRRSSSSRERVRPSSSRRFAHRVRASPRGCRRAGDRAPACAHRRRGRAVARGGRGGGRRARPVPPRTRRIGRGRFSGRRAPISAGRHFVQAFEVRALDGAGAWLPRATTRARCSASAAAAGSSDERAPWPPGARIRSASRARAWSRSPTRGSSSSPPRPSSATQCPDAASSVARVGASRSSPRTRSSS
ncbi:MAG: DUF1501 domain-containing protein [Polyangiaceae bacterium]